MGRHKREKEDPLFPLTNDISVANRNNDHLNRCDVSIYASEI